MITEVLAVLIASMTPSELLLNSTRYDLIMPLGLDGGSHVTIIAVELMLCAVTFNGVLGAE